MCGRSSKLVGRQSRLSALPAKRPMRRYAAGDTIQLETVSELLDCHEMAFEALPRDIFLSFEFMKRDSVSVLDGIEYSSDILYLLSIQHA